MNKLDKIMKELAKKGKRKSAHETALTKKKK